MLYKSFEDDCNMQGIMVNDREHKMTLYTDDGSFYVYNQDICLPVLQHLLDIFGKFSDYKFSIPITQIL